MPALKVSSDQRAELRSQAHALKPVVLIGAEGLTDAVLAEIKVHLGAHQLIKIRVFGDEREERLAIYEQICDTLNAAPIQHIGKLLVIWKPEAAAKPATRAKRGELPSAVLNLQLPSPRRSRPARMVRIRPERGGAAFGRPCPGSRRRDRDRRRHEPARSRRRALPG